MTKAQRNYLAYLHITGCRPKYAHVDTWLGLSVQGAYAFDFETRRDRVSPDFEEHVEGHKAVKLWRRLQELGWQLGELPKDRKVSGGIPITHPHVNDPALLRINKAELWIKYQPVLQGWVSEEAEAELLSVLSGREAP